MLFLHGWRSVLLCLNIRSNWFRFTAYVIQANAFLGMLKLSSAQGDAHPEGHRWELSLTAVKGFPFPTLSFCWGCGHHSPLGTEGACNFLTLQLSTLSCSLLLSLSLLLSPLSFSLCVSWSPQPRVGCAEASCVWHFFSMNGATQDRFNIRKNSHSESRKMR